MTFEESAQLMNDPTFRGRVKVAALTYAQYILQSGPLGNSRFQWAQRTMQTPDQTAQTLVPAVVMNVNVQQNGANTDDPNLQAAVQVVAEIMI